MLAIAVLAATSCTGKQSRRDLGASAVEQAVGVRPSVAFAPDSAHLLVLLPDSLFGDSAAFARRAEQIARLALDGYGEAGVQTVQVNATAPYVGALARVTWTATYPVANLR
jgi:hypothetical protein